jgi:hypothetical protein
MFFFNEELEGKLIHYILHLSLHVLQRSIHSEFKQISKNKTPVFSRVLRHLVISIKSGKTCQPILLFVGGNKRINLIEPSFPPSLLLLLLNLRFTVLRNSLSPARIHKTHTHTHTHTQNTRTNRHTHTHTSDFESDSHPTFSVDK